MITPALLLIAAILPPAIDDWKRTATVQVDIPIPAVAKEFGLAETEGAAYENGPKKFQLAAFRMKDVTGAVALEQSLQSPDKKVFRHQNYVFQTLEGTAPRGALDAFLFPTLPKLDRSAPPTLLGYLPRKGRAVGSERLLLGPESLRAFAPDIPVAAAGFDFAAEVQLAQYGAATLAVLHYPNHAIARQQFAALQLGPNAAILRDGPVVAMVFPANTDPKLAAGLLSQIHYKAEIIMDKAPPKPQPDPAKFLIGVFNLAGVLLALCLGLGLIFALFRAYGRHWSGKKHDDEMTTLGI